MRSERNAFAHRIRRLETEIAQTQAALASLLRLFAEDNHAEHTETVAAVRLLEAAGLVEIVKDADGPELEAGGGGWLEFAWREEV